MEFASILGIFPVKYRRVICGRKCPENIKETGDQQAVVPLQPEGQEGKGALCSSCAL